MGCQQSQTIEAAELVDSVLEKTVQAPGQAAGQPDPASNPSSKTDELPEPDVVRMTLQKEQSARLGSALTGLNMSRSGQSEVVLLKIHPGSLIDSWNASNPSMAVASGDVIVEVNGYTEASDIFNQLASFTAAEITFHRNPARNQKWKAKVAQMCKMLQGDQDQAGEQCKGCSRGTMPKMLSSPQRAGDTAVDFCSICLENVGQDERIMQLPCGHGFHCGCIARWVGRRHEIECPLCRDGQQPAR